MLEGLLAQFITPLRAELDRLIRDYPAPVVLHAAAAKTTELVLQACIDAGPPPDFAERYKITQEQSEKLYIDVLTTALRRSIGG